MDNQIVFSLSYGMVELPEGKMKSREGTVVDADDLIADMVSTAREMSDELGKLDGCTAQEADKTDMCMTANPLETESHYDTTQKQTVEMRSPDGSTSG